MSEEREDLIRQLSLLGYPRTCKAAADMLASDQAALRNAEAEIVRLRALLAGAVSREALIKKVALTRHSEACDGGFSIVGGVAAEAAVDALLSAIAQLRGEDK